MTCRRVGRNYCKVAWLALLVSVVLLAVAPAAWADTTFEAETMALPSPGAAVYPDGGASSGRALELYGNATASKQFSTSATANRLRVRARGNQCNGAPLMTVTIDEKQVLSQSVTGPAWDNYTIYVSVPVGAHTLKTTFANDYASAECDRNLWVDTVSLLSAPTWTSGFEEGDFSEWSWWVRSDGGTFNVANADNEGIPAHGESRVAHFEVSPDQYAPRNVHSKLLNNWAIQSPETAWHDDAGRPLERLPSNNPSGTYLAWFYLPPDYVNTSDRWTNLFQFKESYLDAYGNHRQDPQWWINMSRADAWPSPPTGASGRDPVLHVNHWFQDYANYRPVLMPVPRGRWFQVKAVLNQGDRIDWYLDGQRFDTSLNSTYPVGTLERSVGWVFGIGHYDGIGKLWADDASYAPR